MQVLKRVLKLKFEKHSQWENTRFLSVSVNKVRDVFDAQDVAAFIRMLCMI